MPPEDGLADEVSEEMEEFFRDPLSHEADSTDPRGNLTWPPSDEARASSGTFPDPEDTYETRRKAERRRGSERGRARMLSLPHWDGAPTDLADRPPSVRAITPQLIKEPWEPYDPCPGAPDEVANYRSHVPDED